MTEQKLFGLMDSFAIKVMAIASVAKRSVRLLGNEQALPANSLLSRLFGDPDAIAALEHSLEGQIMPRIWSQGDVVCVVCRPHPDVIVGLISDEPRDPVETYRWSKALDQQVARLWSDIDEVPE